VTAVEAASQDGLPGDVTAGVPGIVPAPVVTQAGVVNIANALTVLRLFLVPVFAAFMAAGDGHRTSWRIAAAIVFAVASITDRVDGQLARSRGIVTSFGVLIDPIADKALTGAAFLSLSAVGDLPWWVTGVVLARELGVTLLRFAVLRHGVMPASRGGKVKTFLQGVAVMLYVLPLHGVVASGRAWLLGVAVVVTVGTGFDYCFRAAAWRRRTARA
jgi:CDP-diacylglycerol--glycerol-3-phosphate 3-phosphatidyltransferase